MTTSFACSRGYLEVDYSRIDFNVIIAAASRTAGQLYVRLLFSAASVPFSRVDTQVQFSPY